MLLEERKPQMFYLIIALGPVRHSNRDKRSRRRTAYCTGWAFSQHTAAVCLGDNALHVHTCVCVCVRECGRAGVLVISVKLIISSTSNFKFKKIHQTNVPNKWDKVSCPTSTTRPATHTAHSVCV